MLVARLRSTAEPDGIRRGLSPANEAALARANLIHNNAFKCIMAACDVAVPCSIENPGSSMLWRSSAFKTWQASARPESVTFDMCQYGCEYRKRTTIWFTGPPGWLHPLGRLCDHQHQHVPLSGWKDLRNPNQRRLATKEAAAYPAALAEAWAELVSKTFGGERGTSTWRPKSSIG